MAAGVSRQPGSPVSQLPGRQSRSVGVGRSAYDRSETGRGRLSTDASLKLLTTCLIRPVTVRPSETTPRQLLYRCYMTSTILENLPQIITSLAALITAVTGLIKVLRDKDK
ncbi:hypothetical protein TUM12128_51210 (plasmid) [Klebsiella pneumoniae]|nr:hypothetical protein TUM12128_51210 [Klebsiella pneumoniae]